MIDVTLRWNPYIGGRRLTLKMRFGTTVVAVPLWTVTHG